MIDKESPTLKCIEKLFDICELLDKYPDMWRKLPDNTIGIDMPNGYSFTITKGVKSKPAGKTKGVKSKPAGKTKGVKSKPAGKTKGVDGK